MKEPDFITTISRLKECVKEAEAAVENKTLKKFVFQFLQPLRNTGFGQGFEQGEESFESLVVEIDLIRERQLKADCQKQIMDREEYIKELKALLETAKQTGDIKTALAILEQLWVMGDD